MIILFILVFVAGFAKAVMDMLQFHFELSIFRSLNMNFWNPSWSWRNKYKNGDPEYGEKFWGSTTIFCLFTDGWHLSQSLFLTAIFASIVLYKPIFNYYDFDAIKTVIDFLILRGIFGLSFTLFYDKILKK